MTVGSLSMRSTTNIPASDRRRPTPLNKQTLWAVLIEFISTFIFVFAVSGSRISLNKLASDATFALIAFALAHAFALSAAVYAAANISGYPYTFCGHVNPAVTFGLFIGGNIHFIRLVLYWIAQLLGSIAACSLLVFVTGGQRVPIYGVSSGVGVGNAVVLEMVMTFGLVFTVYSTMVDPRAKGLSRRQNVYDYVSMQYKRPSLSKIAPLAIGLIVGANVLVGGPFDGASMNPALSFGPALLSWSWANHWVYWVGPLIGGGLVGFVYEFVFISN